MRKKLIALACVLCFSFMMTACSNFENNENAQGTGTPSATVTEQPSNTPTETPTETPTPEPTETPTPTPEPTETDTPTSEMPETSTSTVESTEIPKHTHNYIEAVITEALCNTTGVKQYSCECGDSYMKEYVDTWNHKRDGNRVVGTEATCEEPGTTYEHCIHCGTWMYPEEGAPAKGHEPWDYWIYHHGTGTYRRGCNNCGKLLDETTEKPEGVEIRDFYPRDGLEIIDPFPR